MQQYLTWDLGHFHSTVTIWNLTPLRKNCSWKGIATRNKFPANITKIYIISSSEAPTFYHLIKTRKGLQQIKIRPIVSNYNGPTKRISWIVTKILQAVLSHLWNSDELTEIIINAVITDLTFSVQFWYGCDVHVYHVFYNNQKIAFVILKICSNCTTICQHLTLSSSCR